MLKYKKQLEWGYIMNFLDSIRERGYEIKDEIISWRRALHAIPELRMDTPLTEAKIIEILGEIGITNIKQSVGGHGVCAIINGEQEGKCLAIRADCDGLPINEETGLPFASQNGNMHACGHDSHTAIVLGAAKLLNENKNHLKGSVKFIFQPFEEGDGGAKLMIADGVLENPKVDAITALHNHCTDIDEYQLGDVLVTKEPISANVYSYEATFKGTSSHICLANTANNAVYMASCAIAKIAKLPKENECINAVSMVHGGVRNNIISDTCTVCGSVRAFDRNIFNKMKKQVLEIFNESAYEFGGSVEIKTNIDLMETKNDAELYEKFCNMVNMIYPERSFINLKSRELIGEDFARFADVIPALYFKLHTKPKNSCYPLHHPKFDVNEEILYKGSVLFASFALTWQGR